MNMNQIANWVGFCWRYNAKDVITALMALICMGYINAINVGVITRYNAVNANSNRVRLPGSIVVRQK